jgi:predicted GNAT superfamily acetyltransferase
VSGSYEVRTLHTLDEMRSLMRVADAVWGPPAGSMVSPDFLMALAHTGGYVAGLFDTDRGTNPSSPEMVGCSFGMLGRFQNEYVLHSHITGVIGSAQHKGLGRRLKQHQRAWALENGLTAITWTFDPLVRRNGWFNLHCLGATAEDFYVNFYGPLGDEINGSDETDRLLAHWDISSEHVEKVAHAVLPSHEPQPGDVLIATPADIVEIRRHDPELANTWRLTVRDQLADAFAASHIVGMTHDGAYVLRPRDTPGES